MSGGGKGGKQTTDVKIPKWLEGAARDNMARADELAQIGYTPYFGPDVAAFSPMQLAAMQNTNTAANAFGMAAPADPMAGMPAPQTFAGGVQGHSSQPIFQQSVDALAAARPGQFAALNAPFINPVTGADPSAPFAGRGGQSDQMTPATLMMGMMSGRGSGGAVPRMGSSGGGKGGTSANTALSYMPGGVNTANPASRANTAAAVLTSQPSTVSASSRPMANPRRK